MNVGPGELFSLSCALVWAVAVILFKKSGESLSPFALNLFKNALSLTLLVPTILVFAPATPSIPPLAIALAMLSGLLGIGLADTLYLSALNRIGAGRMAVAQTLYSPFVIALSAAFLGERLRPLQWSGAALVLGGILLVTRTRDAQAGASSGAALRSGLATASLSMLFMAIGIVMAKPQLEQHDFLWIVALRLVGGLAGMLVVVAMRRNLPALLTEYRAVRHWPQVLAGSVTGTYLSMMLWLAGYKYARASVSAVLNETAALFILVLAVIFLRERVGRIQVAGIALALSGVMLVVAG